MSGDRGRLDGGCGWKVQAYIVIVLADHRTGLLLADYVPDYSSWWYKLWLCVENWSKFPVEFWKCLEISRSSMKILTGLKIFRNNKLSNNALCSRSHHVTCECQISELELESLTTCSEWKGSQLAGKREHPDNSGTFCTELCVMVLQLT